MGSSYFGNVRLGFQTGPKHPIDEVATALDKVSPALTVGFAPFAVGYLATQEPELQPHFERKWGAIGGGLANIGAKAALGVGAGLLVVALLIGGGIEAGIHYARHGKLPF